MHRFGFFSSSNLPGMNKVKMSFPSYACGQLRVRRGVVGSKEAYQFLVCITIQSAKMWEHFHPESLKKIWVSGTTKLIYHLCIAFLCRQIQGEGRNLK